MTETVKIDQLTPEIKAVEIRAELRKISTMVDGSANLVLNIPEDCREQVKQLLDWHHMEVYSVISVEPFRR